jgi:hypothetical protein
MKVVGFSFIRNAVDLDYPIREAITSVLPLCDEFVLAVGQSNDGTLDLIRSIGDSRIRILETTWDDSLREGGRTFALETNKAFRGISAEADWAFYIQGDEVLHEKYHDVVRHAMSKHLNDQKVDGLLFNYLHFYGSYDYVGTAYRWYRKEIRVVRNDPTIHSYRDAQGFRKGQNEKLRVKPIDAWMYHYGWVREPAAMQRKQLSFNHFYQDDHWIEKHIAKADAFDYRQIDALTRFEGTHPAVMQERIRRKNWQFDFDISYSSLHWKDRIRRWVEQQTGWVMGEYRNYKLV